MVDFGRKTAAIFWTDVLALGLSLASHFLVAALLGPSQYGIAALLLLVPEYCEKLGRLGVDDAAIYLSGRKSYTFGTILGTSIVLLCGLSSVLMVILNLGWTTISSVLLKTTEYRGTSILMVLVAIPSVFLLRLGTKLLLQWEKVSVYNWVNAIMPIGKSAIVVLAVLYAGMGSASLVTGLAIANSIGAVFAILYLWRVSGDRVCFSIKAALDLLTYGSKLYATNVLQYLHYRVDTVLLAYFWTPQEVGYYSLAVRLVEALRKIPNAFSALLYPRATRSSEEQAATLSAQSVRISLAIVAALMLPALLLAWGSVKYVLGNAFVLMLAPFVVLLPAVLAVTVMQLVMMYFYATGRPTTAFKIVLTGLGINLIFNLVLIPRLAGTGAAISSAVSYVAGALMVGSAFVQSTGERPRSLVLLQRPDLEQIKPWLFLKSKAEDVLM